MATVLAVAAYAAPDAAANFGVYELNLASSSQTTGPMPKTLTVTREVSPEGVKQTTTGLTADGAAFYATYTSKHDGKFVTVTGNAPFDRIEVEQVDANTVVDERKKTGTTYVGGGRTVFSNDGGAMTVDIKGVGADGGAFAQHLVFDKRQVGDDARALHGHEQRHEGDDDLTPLSSIPRVWLQS